MCYQPHWDCFRTDYARTNRKRFDLMWTNRMWIKRIKTNRMNCAKQGESAAVRPSSRSSEVLSKLNAPRRASSVPAGVPLTCRREGPMSSRRFVLITRSSICLFTLNLILFIRLLLDNSLWFNSLCLWFVKLGRHLVCLRFIRSPSGLHQDVWFKRIIRGIHFQLSLSINQL